MLGTGGWFDHRWGELLEVWVGDRRLGWVLGTDWGFDQTVDVLLGDLILGFCVRGFVGIFNFNDLDSFVGDVVLGASCTWFNSSNWGRAPRGRRGDSSDYRSSPLV